jgi:FkbM family methyltransferase
LRGGWAVGAWGWTVERIQRNPVNNVGGEMNITESISILGKTVDVILDTNNDMDFVTLEIRKHGIRAYEMPIPMIIGSLSAMLGGTFLDIGANNGIYSVLFTACNQKAKAVAFEPLEAAMEVLQRNILINKNCSSRIATCAAALSRKNGEQIFYHTINDMGFLSTSSTLVKSFADSVGLNVPITVRTCTLDNFMTTLSSYNPITVLKVDVEGGEVDVFEGGKSTLTMYRPILIVELLGSGNFEFFNKWLNDMSYTDMTHHQSGFVINRVCRFDNFSSNHIFCPSERIGLMSALAYIERMPMFYSNIV